MQIADYEKIVLGLLISDAPPTLEQRKICFELMFDRFKEPVHRLIYKSIQRLINKDEVADIGSIIFHLKSDASRVGGESYMRSLHQFPRQLTSSNLVVAARVVDVAGKLRMLDGLLVNYRKQYEDFENLVMTVGEDVDSYVYDLYHKIEKILVSSMQTTASHTSDLKGRELEVLALAGDGNLVDVLPFGWPTFEENFIPRPATMGVIGGIASRGKTALAQQMAIGVAIMLSETNQQGHVMITELDTSKEKLYRRAACMLASVDSKKLLKGRLSVPEVENYTTVLHYLDTLPLFFDQSQMVEEVKLQASTMAMIMGPRRFGVWDYAELFQFDGGRMSEQERVTHVGLAVKEMSMSMDSCEVLISQFNNTFLNSPYLIGGPYATRNSGALFQQCDWYGEVYNVPEMLNKKDEFTIPAWAEEYYAYFIVHKNKDAETTIIPMTWEAQFTRFRDVVLPANKLYDF